MVMLIGIPVLIIMVNAFSIGLAIVLATIVIRATYSVGSCPCPMIPKP